MKTSATSLTPAIDEPSVPRIRAPHRESAVTSTPSRRGPQPTTLRAPWARRSAQPLRPCNVGLLNDDEVRPPPVDHRARRLDEVRAQDVDEQHPDEVIGRRLALGHLLERLAVRV